MDSMKKLKSDVNKVMDDAIKETKITTKEAVKDVKQGARVASQVAGKAVDKLEEGAKSATKMVGKAMDGLEKNFKNFSDKTK